jgi:hypothetical protein
MCFMLIFSAAIAQKRQPYGSQFFYGFLSHQLIFLKICFRTAKVDKCCCILFCIHDNYGKRERFKTYSKMGRAGWGRGARTRHKHVSSQARLMSSFSR